MAEYECGYDRDRFVSNVSLNHYCPICDNVLKDPVMCLDNEHIFCRSCISRFLEETPSCPVCRDHLSKDTLTDATRFVKASLSELQIRCDYFARGCQEYIELGKLAKHLEDCGFSPSICSNDGCNEKVNKRDLLNHVSERCEMRKVKCHDCAELRHIVEAMMLNLAEQNKKLDSLQQTSKHNTEQLQQAAQRISEKLDEHNDVLEKYIKEVWSTMRNESLEDFLEIKESLEKLNERLINISGGRQLEKKSSLRNDGRPKKWEVVFQPTPSRIIVVGGRDDTFSALNTVEELSLSDNTWSNFVELMRTQSTAAFIILDDGHVIAGRRGHSSADMVPIRPYRGYRFFGGSLHGHACVVHDANLYIIGGYWERYGHVSDVIHRYPLPTIGKGVIVNHMPEARICHAALLFDDDIFILGGIASTRDASTTFNSVLKYSITDNTFTECPPLPFAVQKMAAVRWGDDHIAIMGGVGCKNCSMNYFLMYNVRTGECSKLPHMKYSRHSCSAIVAGQRIIVLGGKRALERNKTECLATVEAFSFKNFSWSVLPPTKQQ